MFTIQKIIKAKNLGEKLIEARTDVGVGLEKAAKDLNIAFKYLEALENNNLAGLPGRPYLKNFLKLYCQYLHLNFADCWNDVRRLEIKEQKKYKNIEGRYFLMWPKFIKRAIIGLIVAAILIFLALSLEKIFAPAPLKIIRPQDGLITKTRQIEIIGQSQKEVEI
ncbi:helix-turn-helix domain-containing protein, partial [Candidatus Falkowbacteria bacterium]|nr:helix-turn-helix domain-containing protein [Candidatus Falkowbacteria bacterium]